MQELYIYIVKETVTSREVIYRYFTHILPRKGDRLKLKDRCFEIKSVTIDVCNSNNGIPIAELSVGELLDSSLVTKEKLLTILRQHIRTYQVDDQAYNPEEEVDRILKNYLNPTLNRN